MTLLDSIRLGVSESVFWYPTFTLPIFAAIWMCALLICLILSPKLGLDRFARWSRNSTLFIASLFVFSLLANAVFVAICRGRIYEPRDPIVDYFPFLPGALRSWRNACRTRIDLAGHFNLCVGQHFRSFRKGGLLFESPGPIRRPTRPLNLTRPVACRHSANFQALVFCRVKAAG
jgi:hypothetical protein